MVKRRSTNVFTKMYKGLLEIALRKKKSIIMSLLCDSNLTSLHFVLCHLRAMQLKTRVFQIEDSIFQIGLNFLLVIWLLGGQHYI
jgi:hypothetical protein